MEIKTPAKSEMNRKLETQIASHRGGSDLWPENSMTAFRNSARLPVEQVEFDIHPTRNGQLVVHHDPTLDRMTDGEGPIVAQTFDELSAFTINGTDNEHIPLLSDVLAVFKPTTLKVRLEIKGDADMRPYPGLEAKVAAELAEHDMLERTVVTSFLIDVLNKFRTLEPDVSVIWLINRTVFRHTGGSGSVIDFAMRHGLREVALHVTDLSAEAIVAGQTAGIHVGAYGADDEASIRRVFELGASVFTTNRPDLALRIRSESSRRDETQ